MDMSAKQYAEMTDWTVCPNWFGDVRLRGACRGHPRFEDGEIITTSPVRKVFRDPTHNDAPLVAVTLNTEYRLSMNPKAEQELLRRFHRDND